MTDELKVALERLSTRGTPAGAAAVTGRALDIARLTVTVPPRRSLPRLSAAIAVAAAAVLVVGAVYLRSRSAQVDRVDLSAVLDDAATTPGVTTVLVVGTDAREGVDGRRADTIMLVRLDAPARRAAVLSVPRDLYVPVPAAGRSDRLSVALRDRESAITTIESTLGVEIDHYAEVDFVGFRRIVDAGGGVKLRFEAPTRDRLAGLDVPGGCVTLDGDGALAFARSRHVETFEAGRWRADPTGDLGRIQRIQYLLLAAVAQVSVGDLATNPVALNRAIDDVSHGLTVDATFSTQEMTGFARTVLGLERERIALLTVPTRVVTVGDAVVLELDAAAAQQTVADFLGGASPPHDTVPGAVTASDCG